MGFFIRSKKNEQKKIDRVIKELEKTNDIGKIGKILAENNLISVPKDKYHNTFGNDLRHLNSDGTLPWGWITANEEFVEQIRTEYRYFMMAYFDSRQKSPKERYAAAKSFARYMRDANNLCASKGECFEYWIGELFDDSYIKEIDGEVDFIKSNFELLEEDYRHELYIKEVVVPNIQKKLPEIIRENPGILQTAVYKMFPVDYKQSLSSELYGMDKRGQIIREKAGRTYRLMMPK